MKKRSAPANKRKRPVPAAPIKTQPPQEDEVRPPERPSFPIVGIGASAGGLEALEIFLRNVPQGSGMAFAVIQHLDPTHKGIMVELLQRATAMKVVQVEDRMFVEPEHVYVIPPNKDMSILHGALHLLDPVAPRGLRLPIDFFFRSLADDLQDRSIGVILSGMGSDGTLGLRSIKEKAGAAFVQAPESAKFDGMPRSAIDAGLADVVAPVEELPGKIAAYLKYVPTGNRLDQTLEDKTARSSMEKIIILLRTQTGQDFSLYKKSTIYRRIERRMGLHQIERIAAYVRFLQENPQETELLFKELLIGVTSFFRDPAVWDHLRDEAIPSLLTRHPAGGVLRAWVAGCSTGEEAYSLAIIFKEALEKVKPGGNFSLLIFATDLDRDAIDKARAGVYPANIAADVTPARLRRFFVQEETFYRVGKGIREMVIFAPQNVIMDPPFTKLDLMVCRNLLIYLTPELQKKVIPLFHYTLNPGGLLFLGSAETVGTFTDLFVPVDVKARTYRRVDTALGVHPVEFPSARAAAPEGPAEPRAEKPAANLQTVADRLILARYAPAAALTNDQGDILYISGRTGSYLEPAAGKANWNIFAMARNGLRYDLAAAFRKALQTRDVVTLKGLKVEADGRDRFVDITVQSVAEPEELKGMVMIVFADAAAPPEVKAPRASGRAGVSDARLLQAEQELRKKSEEIQNTREEMQTSQEELKSTNEELQSTNEELQSTNEELTTSKEEMQSMNEELQTLNHELQAKVSDLSKANNDMKNLLDSTDIATLFLDGNLNVRRFTGQMTKIIKLIPGDVGRPVTDITSELDYPDLAEDAREVMRALNYREKLAAGSAGRWFLVRIMPYRTSENRIDGVVITFIDVTVSKNLEMELRQVRAELEGRITAKTEELKEARKGPRKKIGRRGVVTRKEA
ncbi:MAG: PAS domain-containing protein [Syntrophales bacterium]|jgi:two-component system CheB/CheR fusion protein|nr:PAS domain-containing protein [Syntrophales bacterium]